MLRVRSGTKAAVSLLLLFLNAASAHTAPALSESCNWPVFRFVYEVTEITHPHSTDQTFNVAVMEMSPWGLAGCCLCSVRLCDGKASYQLLIPTWHTRHFLSPPVMLMQLEFHKSNLSSKKVNKFTLYN